MTSWAALPKGRRASLALEVGIIADNTKVVAQQLEALVGKVPSDDPNTIIELNAAAHLIRTVQHSLEARTGALQDSLEEDERLEPPDL